MILVVIVTHSGERYALVPLLAALNSQSVQEFSICMVDNSPENGYRAVLRQALETAFPTKKISVLHVEAEGRMERILQSRERARQYFLDGIWEKLFFLDSDVLIPPDCLALLSSHRPVATGVYLNLLKVGEKEEIRPALYKDLGSGRARPYTIQEVLQAETLPVGAAGLGCCLIDRKVLEAVPLRLNQKGTGEDVMFFRDAVAKGFVATAVCSVKCLHLQFPVGDDRNKVFDLRRYRAG